MSKVEAVVAGAAAVAVAVAAVAQRMRRARQGILRAGTRQQSPGAVAQRTPSTTGNPSGGGRGNNPPPRSCVIRPTWVVAERPYSRVCSQRLIAAG